ncbi:MAG: nucleoside-triphosphatase [Cellulosilyticaceae bacterium]
MTNLFLTGERGVGKSTLLRALISALNIKTTGFESLPYHIAGERRGFYMHGLVTLPEGINNQPISVQDTQMSCVPITHTFENLGVRVLGESLKDESQVILLDELGVLERDASHFWDAVEACLESEKLVIGVIKKTSHQSLERIKRRHDIIVLELTPETREAVYQECDAIIKNYLEGNHE